MTTCKCYFGTQIEFIYLTKVLALKLEELLFNTSITLKI